MMHELIVSDNIVLTHVLFHAWLSYRYSEQKEIVLVDKKKKNLMTMENITLVIDFM